MAFRSGRLLSAINGVFRARGSSRTTACASARNWPRGSTAYRSLSTLWNARRTATVLRGSARCPAVEARQRTGIRACDATAGTRSRRPTPDTVRALAVDRRAPSDRRRSPIARAPVSFSAAAVAVGSTSYTWQQSECGRCRASAVCAPWVSLPSREGSRRWHRIRGIRLIARPA